ncbi:IS4 family transposase [Paenibacillus filicis]|uniref:IS4 family transposase n=1 Tax=Paenibacillus gyeongsangnamensis TaxID=3388067 RepID=A0ABT4Q6Z5_9BACL|nr:IS4 family transposase [Paenibacillus filicis]MCZ8512645.1 IS4 family transposase [Paenibacillus filicis]
MDKDTLFSSFGKWLAPICTKSFTEKVKETNQDKYVKKFTTLSYLKLFLHAQIQQRDGLREIADDVLSKDFQKELGLKSISAAQLSRKHNQVDPALLEHVFMQLVLRIRQHTSPSMLRKDFKIIDSTTIGLCLQKYKWAEFRKTKAGIKLHFRLEYIDDETVVPEKVTITSAKKNDRTQMDALVNELGVTYVYDRGYIDYGRFDDYCDRGIFFVTRTKKNTMIRPIESFSLPPESAVLTDEMVYVGTPQKRMENVLRLIHTVDSEGNPVAILTNRFDLNAEEIGQIYRERWVIETFFKWMKQHIRIKSFYGTSEQAVMNQVWTALIAFCLLVLVKLETGTRHSLLQLYRWLKILLWDSVQDWMERIHRLPQRISEGRRKKQ